MTGEHTDSNFQMSIDNEEGTFQVPHENDGKYSVMTDDGIKPAAFIPVVIIPNSGHQNSLVEENITTNVEEADLNIQQIVFEDICEVEMVIDKIGNEQEDLETLKLKNVNLEESTTDSAQTCSNLPTVSLDNTLNLVNVLPNESLTSTGDVTGNTQNLVSVIPNESVSISTDSIHKNQTPPSEEKTNKSSNPKNIKSQKCKCERYFECVNCHLHFKTEVDFLKHAAATYLKVIPNLFADIIKIECLLCEKGKTVMDQLADARDHLRIHQMEMTTKCKFCSARDTIVLDDENVIIIGDMNNELLPSEKSAIKFYKCKFCDKQFKKMNICKMHVYAHTGLQPSSCHLCTTTLSGKKSFDLHKKNHARIETAKATTRESEESSRNVIEETYKEGIKCDNLEDQTNTEEMEAVTSILEDLDKNKEINFETNLDSGSQLFQNIDPNSEMNAQTVQFVMGEETATFYPADSLQQMTNYYPVLVMPNGDQFLTLMPQADQMNLEC